MRLINHYLSKDELQQQLNDANLLHWLINVKAFTPELKQHVQSVQLKVLSQTRAPFYDDELELLTRSHTKPEGLVRIVMIYADNKPVCFARVAISDDILTKQLRDFDELSNKPIGETLFFNSPDAYRDQFQYFRTDAAKQFMSNLPEDLQKQFCTYGRSSIFNNNNGQVLVTELFSNHIPNLLARL